MNIMSKSQYYYELTDEEYSKIAEMKYIEALEFKISKAIKVLEKIVNVRLEDRDFIRISKVSKAIDFNKDLISEVKDILKNKGANVNAKSE